MCWFCRHNLSPLKLISAVLQYKMYESICEIL
nr:MAG TPA: protein of unknown function UPF0542 [Caudoviricetes sp.]